MEEDVGAKAPGPYLRRRLSVEQSEELKSPSAPSTPSKKRGGRLAAKPQLELIDENSSENTPRKQNKKSAKDVIEASEEKVSTPSRRSTRIRSNTSILSDTPQNVESPSRRNTRIRSNTSILSDTPQNVESPSRRNTRIRSNTSIVSDTTQNVESPRAKRAARRNSQIGRSTTAAIDSTIDEVQSDGQKSSVKENEKSEIAPIRKSPRLQKKNKQDISENKELIEPQESNNIVNTSDKTNSKISDDSFKLINNLDEQPINKKHLNNSASSVNSKKSKRNRTNTWSAAQNSEDSNDITKQKQIKINEIATDDNIENTENYKNIQTDNTIINANSEIDKHSTESVNNKTKSFSSDSPQTSKVLLDKSNSEKSQLDKGDDTENHQVLNEAEKIFQKAPVAAVKSLIYFDDSDSDSRGKPTCTKPIENEDQCVPVVSEINQKGVLSQNENDKVSYNDTCEPMDIDETNPNNMSQVNCSDSKQDKDLHEIEKSLEHKLNHNEDVIKSCNNSKRESTASLSTLQNIEKTGNDNQSTLILSQLKDVSTTDNSLTKSPKSTVEFLSKSVEINRDNEIKASHEYMTSTPLQQKNLKKMAIQINTSLINNSNNRCKEDSVVKHKNNNSNQFHKSADKSSSEESDPEDVSTKEKSDFLDDEAEEASDDYESGDSQDEEDKKYVKENEILERGETLDSDDNASNDTDYENDSFVVSSDEEDNDLLSGSGDDLSMSDNELTMSKKSKKKFNERKLKEQKKASKEMYEARHNISNNSSKSKVIKPRKYNRQRLNSSTLMSEEETVVKSKKNKKLKLDSSQDSHTENIDTHQEVIENNVSMTEEHEITSVCNESVMNKNDPLSTKIKIEPRTPLKDMNMSTIPILDEIEEVQLNNNASIIKTNETSDPLQEDSDASSISENMEITSNYDSVLKGLNDEMKSKKIKSVDTSLNLVNKAKKSANASIVDNLNLTNTRKTKPTGGKPAKKDTNDESSDSIDLQLLFSEDSCDSMKKDKSKQNQENEPNDFIPLKRTEAKTNILEENNNDSLQIQQDSMNNSMNKKKKRNSLSVNEDIQNITNEKNNVSLNQNSNAVSRNSMSESSSKKKKKKNSLCVDEIINGMDNTILDNLNISQTVSSQNISLNTSSKKKKKNNLSVSGETNDNVKQSNINENKSDCNVSTNDELNISSKKKNKKHSVSSNNDTDEASNVNKSEVIFQNHNISVNTSSKKKKRSISFNEEVGNVKENVNSPLHISQDNNKSLNTSLNTSSTKKKKKTSISEETDIINNISMNKSNLDMSVSGVLNTSTRKNKKNNVSTEDAEVDSRSKLIEVSESNISLNPNESLTESSKKKKKRKGSVVGDLDLDTTDKVDIIINNSLNSSTKKKKKDKDFKDDYDSDAAPEEVPYTSHKNISTGDVSDGSHIFMDTEGNQDWNTLITSESSKKKNKKKKEQENPPLTHEVVLPEIIIEEITKSKKRKRNTSGNSTSQEIVTTDSQSIDEAVPEENKRKKQKLSQSEDISSKTIEPTRTKKKNKKRKERDDDDEAKLSKVFKQNSTDKINVPRLPTTILNQLEDKPRKELLEMKKANLVSTSQFIVEEAKKRKNKPSNYLEESVYLNDSVDEKKQKGFIKIPKVLPFVPTATISGSGFTTKFQINVLQKETKFVAQTSNMTGFKNEYLGGKKIKRVGTYELYKSQRNKKLSKF